MSAHVHTPELRLRRDYLPSPLLPADSWVCAECETFLGWSVGQVLTEPQEGQGDE